jgi:hypothetical protein
MDFAAPSGRAMARQEPSPKPRRAYRNLFKNGPSAQHASSAASAASMDWRAMSCVWYLLAAYAAVLFMLLAILGLQ